MKKMDKRKSSKNISLINWVQSEVSCSGRAMFAQAVDVRDEQDTIVL